MTFQPAASHSAATPAYEFPIGVAAAPRPPAALFGARAVSDLRDWWDLSLLAGIVLAVFQPWNSTLLAPQDFGVRFVTWGLGVPAWYWTLFAINCVVLVLARELFLRTGVNRSASFIGLALWATMAPTAEAWVAPSAEMFGMIFFLSALLLALNYADAPDWRLRGILIAVGVAGLICVKAALGVLVPVIFVVACAKVCDGSWTFAKLDERARFLLLVVVVASATALASAFFIASVSSQGVAVVEPVKHTLAVFMHRLEVALIPASPRLHRLVNIIVDPGWTLLFVLPNLLWIRLVGGGIAAGRRRLLWPLLVSAIWVSAGLLLYAGSTETRDVIMLPFALGAMFGAAHALTAALKGSKARRLGVMTAGAILIAASSVEGRSVVYSRQLREKLYSAVVTEIANQKDVRTLVGATPQPKDGNKSWSRSIAQLGAATRGVRVPGYKDLSCQAALEALKTGHRDVVVSTGWGCGKLSASSTAFRSVVPRYQWPWLWERNQVEAYMYVAVAP